LKCVVLMQPSKNGRDAPSENSPKKTLVHLVEHTEPKGWTHIICNMSSFGLGFAGVPYAGPRPRRGEQPALKHMNYSMYEKWFAGVLEAWDEQE
jgi:hypothetical protein